MSISSLCFASISNQTPIFRLSCCLLQSLRIGTHLCTCKLSFSAFFVYWLQPSYLYPPSRSIWLIFDAHVKVHSFCSLPASFMVRANVSVCVRLCFHWPLALSNIFCYCIHTHTVVHPCRAMHIQHTHNQIQILYDMNIIDFQVKGFPVSRLSEP